MGQIDALVQEKMRKMYKNLCIPLNQDVPLNPLNPYGGWAPSGVIPKHSFGMISISSLAKIASLELLNSRIMVLYIKIGGAVGR